MRGGGHAPQHANRAELVVALTLALGIFALDAFTPLKGAVAVLYTVAILIAARHAVRRLVIAAGVACAWLALVGYFISHWGEPLGSSAMRLGVSLVAIAIVSFLTVRNLSAAEERGVAQARLDQAQAELAHVSRVNLLGQLAASIAHEVNQPLAAIVTNARSAKRWLDREIPDREEAGRCLDHIALDGERAGDIIARIRDLARQADPRRDRFDLGPLIQDTIALLLRELQSHAVVVRATIPPHLPNVVGDRVQIQQVLMNLMLNADQAMTQTRPDRRELRLAARSDEQNVIVEVRDHGPGIADGEQLFSPFYTTKPDGMGMGLSISRSIVERHGGKLTADNDPDGGATFRFSLPLEPVQQTNMS